MQRKSLFPMTNWRRRAGWEVSITAVHDRFAQPDDGGTLLHISIINYKYYKKLKYILLVLCSLQG